MSEYIIKAADWAIDYKGESLFKSCEEVVRCRDCRYYEPDGEPSAVDASWHWCDRMMQYLEPDGFCKWGRRDV